MRLTLSVSCLIISIALFSCHKNNDPSPAPPTPVDSVRHFSTNYLASAYQIQTFGLKKYELVVSEPAGKVVLDTITTINTPLNADLVTRVAALDISVIAYDSSIRMYVIEAVKGVDPLLWTALPGSDSVPGKSNRPPTPPMQPTTIKYTHVPLSPYDVYYSVQQYTGLQTYYPGSADSSITVNYNYSSSFTYFLFPKARLYNFHRNNGPNDVVDLSHMDTARAVKFSLPANNTIDIFFAYGYPDTTDIGTLLKVTMPSNNPSLYNADLIYPGGKAFQKYYYDMVLSDTVHNAIVHYVNHWCDTVSATPFIPSVDYYTVTSAKSNNFSVQFSKQRPGYYTTQWNAPNSFST
ncbi:hypothetical protein ACQ86N_00885 [Puia sp. P3]|uniref:hypothetical protein n=1 Tax=Puia sp. P3 TaxID=3423952 RepID=UPI003D679301